MKKCTEIDRSLIAGECLSPGCLGVLVYAMSIKDQSKVTRSAIKRRFKKEASWRVDAYIDRLVELGFASAVSLTPPDIMQEATIRFGDSRATDAKEDPWRMKIPPKAAAPSKT